MAEPKRPDRPPLCQCPEPFGDIREGVCQLCGRQVPGFGSEPIHTLFLSSNGKV